MVGKYEKPRKMRYKVFSRVDNIKQTATVVSLDNVEGAEIYDHINEVLQDRFRGYKLSIDHIGQSVCIEY